MMHVEQAGSLAADIGSVRQRRRIVKLEKVLGLALVRHEADQRDHGRDNR